MWSNDCVVFARVLRSRLTVGIVFGAIMGIVVLKEAQGARRIVAAGLVAMGVVVLGIFG